MATSLPEMCDTELNALIFALGFVDLFGSSMVVNLHSKYITSIVGSPLLTGVVLSSYGGMQFLAAPFIGAFNDKVGCFPMMVLCSLICSIGYVLNATSSVFTLVLLSRVIVGCFKFNQDLCRNALHQIQFKKPLEKQAPVKIGLYNSISTIGFIMSPLVVGYLSGYFDDFKTIARVSYLLCASCQLSFFITSLLICRNYVMFSPMKLSVKDLRTILRDTGFNFSTSFKGVPWGTVWDTLVMRFLISFAVQIYRGFYREQLEARFSISEENFSYLLSFGSFCSTLGGFAVEPLLLIIGYRFSFGVYVGIVVLLIVMIVAYFTESLFVIFLLCIPFSCSTAFLRVSTMQLSVLRAGPANVGKVTGVGSSLVAIGRALSPSVAAIAISFSPVGPIALATIIMAISLCLYSCILKFRTGVKSHND